MNESGPLPASQAVRTTINCSKCGKAASVPFTPTPGRPVFCRDCFAKAPPPAARPARSFARAPPDRPVPSRKRMMAQGRKTHFLFDAKAALAGLSGGMDEKDHRAFLEGLFARGARQSTQAAQEFLDAKAAEEVITVEQRDALGRLVERYSFWR